MQNCNENSYVAFTGRIAHKYLFLKDIFAFHEGFIGFERAQSHKPSLPELRGRGFERYNPETEKNDSLEIHLLKFRTSTVLLPGLSQEFFIPEHRRVGLG